MPTFVPVCLSSVSGIYSLWLQLSLAFNAVGSHGWLPVTDFFLDFWFQLLLFVCLGWLCSNLFVVLPQLSILSTPKPHQLLSFSSLSCNRKSGVTDHLLITAMPWTWFLDQRWILAHARNNLWFACSVTQLCPTLCDPMDCSLPGFSVHGISQARILEWVAISFSRGSSRPSDWTHVSWIGRWILYHWATTEDASLISIASNLWMGSMTISFV